MNGIEYKADGLETRQRKRQQVVLLVISSFRYQN